MQALILLLFCLPFLFGSAVGRIPMEVSVDPQGSSTLNFQIDSPLTTRSLKPGFSISYKSSRASSNGLLGLGFYLKGLSNIHPCPKTIFNDGVVESVQLTETDRLCLDGERLVALSNGENGSSVFFTQKNTMTKVESNTDEDTGQRYFVVSRNDGLKSTYSATKYDESGKVVLAWGKTQVEDTMGNYYTFSYDDSFLLTTVDLTMNSKARTDSYAQVKFSYEQRPDVIQTYIQGYTNRKMEKRLSGISVILEGRTRLSYSLQYTQSCSNGASQLTKITKCAGSECISETLFQYDENCSPKFPSFTLDDLPIELSPVVPIAEFDLKRIKPGSFGGSSGLSDFYVIQNGLDAIYIRNPDGSYYKKNGLNTVIRAPMPDAEFDVGRYKFIDFNQNGYLDIYMVSPQGACEQDIIFINDGTGKFGSMTIKGPATCISSNLEYAMLDLSRIRFADFDGDGNPDVYFIQGTEGEKVDDIYLNGGGGKSWTRVDGLETSVTFRTATIDFGRIRIQDMNGDGKTDIHLINSPLGGSAADSIYQSLGQGKFSNLGGPVTKLSSPLSWASVDLSRVKYGDFNGDGLMDIYHVNGLGSSPVIDTIFYNTGGDGSSWPQGNGLTTRVSNELSFAETDLMRIRIMSLNNDKYSDVYLINGAGETAVADDVYLSQGNGNFVRFVGPLTKVSGAHDLVKFDLSRFFFGGFSGSGYLDLFLPQQSSKGVLIVNDFRDSILLKVIDGFGEYSQFDYSPLTSPTTYVFSEPVSKFPVRDVSSPLYVVSKLHKDDGIGGELVTEYTYTGARFHSQGLGFLGFSGITQVDSTTKVKKVISFSQEFEKYLAPQMTHIQLYTENGIMIREEKMDYESEVEESKVDSASVYSVYSEQKVVTSNDQYGNFLSSSITYFSYDTYWNEIETRVIQKDIYGVHETVTTMTYATNENNWILGMKTSQKVNKTSNGKCCVSEQSVKTITFQRNTENGLLLRVTELPDVPELCRVTVHEHDSFGNPNSEKKYPCSNTSDLTLSSTTYDPLGRFIVKKVNPKKFSESFVVDGMFGVDIEHTNIVGLKKTRKLDGFGRIVELRDKWNNVSTSYEWCNSKDFDLKRSVATPVLKNAKYCVKTVSTNGKRTLTMFDRKGRKILVQKSSMEHDTVQEFVYDSVGNLAMESTPYFYSTNESSKPKWNIHEYDVFRRRVKTTDVNGNMDTWTYSKGSVDFVNAKGQKIMTAKDSREKIVQRVYVDTDQSPTKNIVTEYRYDSRRNIVETTDPKGNKILFQYDLYNRKIMETDPDAGKITYFRDTRGNVLRKMFNNGDMIEMKYDVLDRVTERNLNGTISTFHYDEQLPGLFDYENLPGVFSKSLKYDKYGRLKTTTTTIGSKSFVSSQNYDSRNRLSRKVFPNGATVCYEYNELGYRWKTTDCGLTTYEEITSINAFGSMTSLTYGNGIRLTNTRTDDNRLIGINSRSSGGVAIQDLIYEYDEIGRMTNRTDSILRLTETFQYDCFNRLTDSFVNGYYPYTYRYDELGNLVEKSNYGSVYLYESSRPHAVTKILAPRLPDINLQYDEKGNMITQVQSGSVTRRISYNAENKPTRIQTGNYEIEFLYDAFGKRYQRNDKGSSGESSTTFYVGKDYQVVLDNVAGVATEKVFIHNIVHETTEKNVTVWYVLRDHLGSVDNVMDQSQISVKRESYDPFGQPRDWKSWRSITVNSSFPALRKGYTNQEMLWIAGLIHMNGRLYDPMIGRFMSCDPYVQDIFNLQNFNRYSYAFNNPLVTTDPSGYFSFSHFFHSVAKAVGNLVHDIAHAIGNLVHDVENALKSPLMQSIVKIAFEAVGTIFAIPTGGASFWICTGLDMAYTGMCVELDGGSFKQALEAAMIEGAEDIVNHYTGEFLDVKGAGYHLPLVEKGIIHGAIGGGFSELRGESPVAGFVSGFAGEIASELPHSLGLKLSVPEYMVYGATTSGLVGGLSSVASGGKFMNGALEAEKGFWLNSFMGVLKEYRQAAIGMLANLNTDLRNAFSLYPHEPSISSALGYKGPMCATGGCMLISTDPGIISQIEKGELHIADAGMKYIEDMERNRRIKEFIEAMNWDDGQSGFEEPV